MPGFHETSFVFLCQASKQSHLSQQTVEYIPRSLEPRLEEESTPMMVEKPNSPQQQQSPAKLSKGFWMLRGRGERARGRPRRDIGGDNSYRGGL